MSEEKKHKSNYSYEKPVSEYELKSTDPKPTHDEVEICFVLLVKLNVERNHKHNLNEDFIRGVMQGDDTPNEVGDKAMYGVSDVFQEAGFTIEDGEHMSSIAGVKIKQITIDEEKESPECPVCKGGMFHNGDLWLCDHDDCDGEISTPKDPDRKLEKAHKTN